MKNLFGSLHIVKVKKDVNHTSIVEFTQLLTNTTEGLSLNYGTQIIKKMENFIMKPRMEDGQCGQFTDLTENAFTDRIN